MIDSVVDDLFEQYDVHVVVDAVLERDVQREMLAHARTVVFQLAGAGEEVARVLVEGDGHYAVGVVKRELDTVAMVNVDVNVQDTRVVPGMVDEWPVWKRVWQLLT